MARVARNSRTLAVVATVAISVFALGACTSAVEGDATYNGAGLASDTGSNDTGSNDTGSNDTGSNDTGSSDTGSSGTGGSDDPTNTSGVELNSDEGAVDADAKEPFTFPNDTTVTVDSIKTVDYSGLITNEVGRGVMLTVTNKSDVEIDTSSYLQLSSVYCDDDYSWKAYILKSEDITEPQSVAAGATEKFELPVAMKPEYYGKCILNFNFEADNTEKEINAKFSITIK